MAQQVLLAPSLQETDRVCKKRTEHWCGRQHRGLSLPHVRLHYGRAPRDQRCGGGGVEPERRPGQLVASSDGRRPLTVVCLRVHPRQWLQGRRGGGAGGGELRVSATATALANATTVATAEPIATAAELCASESFAPTAEPFATAAEPYATAAKPSPPLSTYISCRFSN